MGSVPPWFGPLSEFSANLVISGLSFSNSPYFPAFTQISGQWGTYTPVSVLKRITNWGTPPPIHPTFSTFLFAGSYMVFLGPRSNFVNPTSPSICGTFWHSFTGFGFHLPILQFFQFSHPFWDSLTLHPLFKGFFGTFSFPFFPSDFVGLLSHYSLSDCYAWGGVRASPTQFSFTGRFPISVFKETKYTLHR